MTYFVHTSEPLLGNHSRVSSVVLVENFLLVCSEGATLDGGREAPHVRTHVDSTDPAAEEADGS